jgi:hypothetical protein
MAQSAGGDSNHKFRLKRLILRDIPIDMQEN